ncbi:MAG: ABC transporter permease [Rhodospirillaceae bacterium]
MLRNYLAAALRNLTRNRLYAATNIVGLAVGFAAALLITLFIRDELSFESWMPGSERTFIVRNEYEGPMMGLLASDRSEVRMAEWLRSDFSSIESAARLSKTPISRPPIAGIRHGDVEGNERLYWADPNIFSVLRLPAVAGDLTAALEKPDGIVLTRRMARKYFGRDDPIGEAIELDRQHSMTVTAVLADLPSDTHLNFDFLASGKAAFSDLTRLDGLPPLRGGYQAFTYFRLKPGADIAQVRKAMPAFRDRHGITASLKPATDTGAKITFPLMPITDIHLSKGMLNFLMKPRGNIATVYALGAIAFLLVLVAGINFVSLMTARAVRRAVEVGIRKVSGAMRRQLALQFIGESVIYVSIGLALAAALAAALVPAFNAYLQRDSIALSLWRDLPLTAGLIGAALLIGGLAGIYPALVLPSFNPATVLKGGAIKNVGSAAVRRGLVVVQFALLIGLLLASLIVYRQTSFAFNEGMRMDSSQILLVRTNCETPFKDQVRQLPGVRAAACSSAFALNYDRTVADVPRPDGVEIPLDLAIVDFGFFEIYGIRPVTGRLFSPDQGLDTGESPTSAIINETAARTFGFKSDPDAIGQTVDLPKGQAPTPLHQGAYQIVGVVPDVSVDAVHEQINPAAYFVHTRGHQYLSVKLSGDNIPETLAAIDRLWAKAGEPRAITRTFLDQRVQELYLDITRQSQLFSLFAGIAVFIACLGLFGLSAFTAETRTKEIGIRKAMGASHVNILGLLLWEFSKPVLWANAIAWPVGYLVMRRWLEGFAYHIEFEPWVFLTASTAALLIAILTVAGHAFLVARAEPVKALRYE